MSIRPLLASLSALLLTVAVSLLLSSPPAGAAAGWQWPVEGDVLTAYGNGNDPYAAGQHRGVDIAADPGTPVAAVTAGTVRFAGVAGSSGLTVSVRTSDGTLDVSYLHLSEVSVSQGEEVEAGRSLGAVGTTGRRSAEAAHLHLGVRDAGSRHAYHDPLSFLPPATPRTAPEPPREVVPAPEPVPVAPVPVPVPVRVPDPVRVPAARPVRLPLERPVRVPAARRLPLPLGRRAPGSAPSPATSPVGSPVLAPGRAPAPVRHAGSAPALAPNPSATGAPHDSAHGARAGVGPLGTPQGLGPAASADRSPRPASPVAPRAQIGEPGGGPDIGWALACAGLLAAALALGRPGDGERPRGAGTRGRSGAAAGLRALTRPLTGGR